MVEELATFLVEGSLEAESIHSAGLALIGQPLHLDQHFLCNI